MDSPIPLWMKNVSAFRIHNSVAEEIATRMTGAFEPDVLECLFADTVAPAAPDCGPADLPKLSQDLRRDLAQASSAVEAASRSIDALLNRAADDISELTRNVGEVNGLIAGTILSPRQRQFSVGVAAWIEELCMLTRKTPSLPQDVPGVAEPRCATDPPAVLHILVADDNRINQQLAVACLEAAGHSVDVVENGREAVEAVRAQHYDAVLMDLDMPELGGLGATAQIRALPKPLGGVPIIALTASGEPEWRASCIAAGMDAYLSKPFVASALLELLQQVGANRPAAGE